MTRPLSTLRQRGAAAVELALISIPLVLTLLAGVEWARAMMTYNNIVKATRDGARYLSGFDPADSGYPVARMKSRMIYGRDSATPGVDPPIVPGLTDAMIKVCDRLDSSQCDPSLQFAAVPSGPSVVNLVRVEVSGYQFVSIFPIPGGLGAISFEPISTTMAQVN